MKAVDGFKRCSKCGETKPAAEFSRRGSALQTWCRACAKEYQKTPAGKATQARAAAKYQKTPAGKAAQARADAKWAKAHPEEKRAAAAAFEQANRAKALLLMGHICTAPGCSHDLHEIAWGAHHITPRAVTGRKLINWNWSWPKIEAELLNDCELLCTPCHRAADEHKGISAPKKCQRTMAPQGRASAYLAVL